MMLTVPPEMMKLSFNTQRELLHGMYVKEWHFLEFIFMLLSYSQNS